MYLARKEIGPRQQTFILRQTYRSGGVLVSRDLADLGGDPGKVFIYDDDCSFHVDEAFVSHLKSLGVEADYGEIEELFFPFIDPYIQHRLQPFRNRSKYRNWRPAGEEQRRRALAETHAVDRRRLHFLRLGRSIAEGETGEKVAALYTLLLDKSRDEIEQMLMAQEMVLKPREYQSYLFTTFDLSRFFNESYARTMPQALNRDRLDSFFLEEICRLAADADFWRGYPQYALQPPLIRYLIMYFDGVPEQAPTWAHSPYSTGQRRFHRSHFKAGEQVSRSQAFSIFGLSPTQLSSMRKRDLTRIYRQKALELHPDKGGAPELFIRLTAAYEELLPSVQ
ncbi:MAG: J domain-containing protein [Desulfobulbus sp.]|nr:J domain-containing protein [Desulfobulbus sp.]